MAPPLSGIELTKFEKCDVKKDYGRLLRLETCYMDEDVKVAALMRTIPDLWRRRMCRMLLKNDISETITSEDIFKFIDETVKENCERQSIAVMISDVYNIKFDHRMDSALSEFLMRLEEGYENIIDDKKVIKICVVIAFINGIPNRCKESLCTSNRLPTFDEVHKFAMEEDIKFKNRSRYQRNSWRRNSLDEKNEGDSDKRYGSQFIKKEGVKLDKKFDDKNKKLKSSNNSETKKPEVVFQNLAISEERKICTARCKIEGYDSEVVFGIDSCAEISTIPKKVFDQLPEALKEKLNSNAKTYRVQGIHETESVTQGSLIIKLSICESEHKDMEIEVFVDPLSSMPLLCFDHLKRFNINPIDLGLKKDLNQFKDARTGLIFGGEAPLLKKVLLEPDSRVLLDVDYEPGNKLLAKFSVSKDYVPTRPKILPISKNIEHLVLKELDVAVSKGWMKRVKDGTIVENINQMVVVKKVDEDGNLKVRICHACLNVNKYINLPELPELPNIKELLLMPGLETLSLFDIKSAFNRISLHDSCKKYCYIGTPFGIYESQVLIFGLRISPYLFYKAMRKLFEDMEDMVKIYIDDLINVSPLSIHDEVNAEICKRLRKYNLKLSPNKCFVNVRSAIFLGFKVDLDAGVTIPKQKLQALLGIECPETPLLLKKVIAKFQYFSMTVPNFPILVEPLHKQTCKSGVLSENVGVWFEELKNSVAKAISLEYIKEGCKSLSVYLACSRPYALGGRSLRNHEVNYLEGTKLLLALKEILYENMVIATCFEIICYTSVKSMDKLMKATPKVAVNSHQRVMIELLPFQITYKFCNTKENVISLLVESKFDDIMNCSKVMNNLTVATPFNYEPLDPAEIKLEYLMDQDAKILAEIATTGKWTPEQKLMVSGTFKSKLDAVTIKEGLLYVEGKLFVPQNLIEKTINWLHRHHQSYNGMINESKKYFLFNSISSRLREKYNSCVLCNNHRRNKVRKISSWPSVDFSHERFHGDIGEFKGKKFLCLYDCFSGYCATESLKSESSSEVLKALISMYDRVGRPMIQIFDNAACFAAQKTLDELENLKIIVKYSIPHVSQSNGSGEKGIDIIKSRLAKMWDIKKDFKVGLAKATIAANERVFNNGKSARELFFGYESKITTLMKKYEELNQPMDCEVLFKMKWGDKEWLKGRAIERLSENSFVVEYEKKLYVKKIDVINFLKEGKIVSLKEILSDYQLTENAQVEEKAETLVESMSNNEKCEVLSDSENENTQLNVINGMSNRARRKLDEVVQDYKLISEKADSEIEFQEIVRLHKPQLICATDGSEKDGKGFAYIISSEELNINVQNCFKGAPRASAQTLEALALYHLVDKLNDYSEVISGSILIAIDNQYVYDGLAVNLTGWEANSWKKMDNGVLAHGELWKCIREKLRNKSWVVVKVRSHKGIKINEEVDLLARKGASLSTGDIVSIASVVKNNVS
uniref:Reverse transcriptase domain-containing protein n=1 Tax=Strongyloides papillosus TaxID=174720 RepID=A0A0N5B4A3_STREA